MKSLVAIIALGAALVLTGASRGGSTSAPGHGILLLGADNDAARIFVWRFGSPVRPLIGPQRWGLSGGGDFFAGMSDGFWSPNGRLIAFEQDDAPSLAPPDPGIVVMHSDGTHLRWISSGDGDGDGEANTGRLPSWSPSGRQIIWQRPVITDPDYDIAQEFAVVDVHSRHERTLPPGLATSDPQWGKPGIAYDTAKGITLLNPVTRNTRLVKAGVGGTFAWSPRGVLAVAESKRIVLVTASGRVLGKLPLPPTKRNVCAMAWGPNGKRILVATTKDGWDMEGLWLGTVATKRWLNLSPAPTWLNYKYECGLSWR